ncbi:putative lipoprotein [Fulvivirga imtechensis AK7]|uniref:Putative lipoprotein n=2 Tax=Fulvivirga TaxID=396811 RepID=L8JX87_9BACT|nr:putative lipoprotein [Fulvivirga imtechensis AK7]
MLSTAAIVSACSDDDTPTNTTINNPLANPEDGPPAGNPDGKYPIPMEAGLADITNPDQVIGNGTPESCTGQLVVEAIAQGGKIVFNCGEEPLTIILPETAKIFNDANNEVVIDGGGLITLSGGGVRRILYMNTCDPDQNWTTSHCQDQDHPRLTVQNITFANGNSSSETEYTGGGAIWARGGQLKVVNCRFFNNICASTGPDLGGGAIRVFDQYQDRPVYVVNSTFGGAEGYGNSGSNGGAISSIGVSWTIINSLFSHNSAVGNGGNPAEAGTPGGGSGGAIYNDGNEMTLRILGSIIEENEVNAYGAAIFFVSNNHTGNIVIDQSIIRNNKGGSWYPVYPDISMHEDTDISVTDSEIVD